MEIKKNIRIFSKKSLSLFLILAIPYLNNIISLIFLGNNYISDLALMFPCFCLFYGFSCYELFLGIKNNYINKKFWFNILISIMLGLIFIYATKFLFDYNITSNLFFYVTSLVLMELFYVAFSVNEKNSNLIIIFLLDIFLSIFLFNAKINVFISLILTYLVLITMSLLINRKKLIFKNIKDSYIHNLTLVGGNFLLKAFSYLLIIYFINSFGIINNICSYYLITIILDLFFLPCYEIIFENLFISNRDIINISTITIVLEVIFTAILYIILGRFLFIFNINDGILYYARYIFKIITISNSFLPLSYIINAYFISNNKFKLSTFYLIFKNVILLSITVFAFSKFFKLNGILFAIPFTTIVSDLIFLIIIKINKKSIQN